MSIGIQSVPIPIPEPLKQIIRDYGYAVPSEGIEWIAGGQLYPTLDIGRYLEQPPEPEPDVIDYAVYYNHQIDASESGTGYLTSIQIDPSFPGRITMHRAGIRTFGTDTTPTIGLAGVYTGLDDDGTLPTTNTIEPVDLANLSGSSRFPEGGIGHIDIATIPEVFLGIPLVLGAGTVDFEAVIEPPESGVRWLGCCIYLGTSSAGNLRAQTNLQFSVETRP